MTEPVLWGSANHCFCFSRLYPLRRVSSQVKVKSSRHLLSLVERYLIISRQNNKCKLLAGKLTSALLVKVVSHVTGSRHPLGPMTDLVSYSFSKSPFLFHKFPANLQYIYIYFFFQRSLSLAIYWEFFIPSSCWVLRSWIFSFLRVLWNVY